MRFVVAVSEALPLLNQFAKNRQNRTYIGHAQRLKSLLMVPLRIIYCRKKGFRIAQGIASNRNLSGCDIRPAPFKTVIHLYQSHKNKRRNQAGKEYAAVPDVFHSM